MIFEGNRVSCLENIGHHLKATQVFNIAGGGGKSLEIDHRKELSEEEWKLVEAYNEVDIQSYERVKKQSVPVLL